MNNQQAEILAKAIEGEAADAARLSTVKSGLAMKAQDLIKELNLPGALTVGYALEFSEQAEVAMREFVARKVKGATLSAGACADLLEAKGSYIIEDFVEQLKMAQSAAIRKKAERKAEISRK